MRCARGELGEVPHDEEVFGEAGLRDDAEFIFETLDLGRAGGSAVALIEPLEAEIAQVLLRAGVRGEVGVGELEAAELQRHVAAFGDAGGGLQRLRQVWEARAHLLLVGEVEVLAVQLEAVGLVHGGVGADAEQHLMGEGVVGGGVVGVVRGDEGEVQLAPQLHQLGDDG